MHIAAKRTFKAFESPDSSSERGNAPLGLPLVLFGAFVGSNRVRWDEREGGLLYDAAVGGPAGEFGAV